MKQRASIPKELLTSIDVLNTLNGGTSEPRVRVKQYPGYRQITIEVPGVTMENVKVEINNNQLMIYFFYTLVTMDQPMQFPRVLYDKSIPYFVDVNNITASQEDHKLVVRLPFNELANGQHREIRIKQ
ncbi:MAG: Hsp20/alpha crystallin family protein [Bacteroidetes bacterium]|nr:Hsp20/alpha crystallin family protein [Bacteroidota bacterium]